MKLIFFFAAVVFRTALAADTFNYGETQGTDYGLKDWDQVSCGDLETCPGWPDKHLASVGWKLTDWKNNCEWCPVEGGNSCGQHRQSPIELFRDRADPSSPNWKECEDWHWMKYEDGTCNWEHVKDQFSIERHALQYKIPLRSDGEIGCQAPNGERRFPRLDYSKGFNDWWFLSQTEISTPSEHVQQGKRYAAEVTLSHFYEFDSDWKHVGKVAIFLQDYEGEAPWHYLDKLICMWRRAEEETRKKCNLPPAPVYKMCELYRGQSRTPDDFEAPTAQVTYPTYKPLDMPKERPIVNYGGDPPLEKKPLQLCEGDCDLPGDCAKGLICHRRDAFEYVPGCIGGESDPTNTDYCIFDVYGEGYDDPTDRPTTSPTTTQRPTLVPLPLQPLVFFGGTPPADKLPLQFCQGDCDDDSQCAPGLICFQRDENTTVPGCIGGETDNTKTDYCILDPYGSGYTLPPTDQPTFSPTTSEPTSTKTPTEQPTTAGPTVPTTGSPTTQSPTARPARPLKSYGGTPPADKLPLHICEGDCDNDSQCASGLICFQRNENTTVPGCVGGDTDNTKTDYCILDPFGSTYTYPPTKEPTAEPSTSEPTITTPPTDQPSTAGPTVPRTPTPTVDSASPTMEPTDRPRPTPAPKKKINNRGWEPPLPLGECEGDCDDDTDCGPNLVCFQRNSHRQAVPGCDGGELDETLTDYCVYPVKPTEAPTATPTTGHPTYSPVTVAPTVSAEPTAEPTETPLKRGKISFHGWTPGKVLMQCEGDCDSDRHCKEGLICFQRNAKYMVVPGCDGGEADSTLIDYCIDPRFLETPSPTDSTPAPTKSPTSTPPAEDDATVAPVTTAPTESSIVTPTASPTKAPTAKPTTGTPTTLAPTKDPTVAPSDSPTKEFPELDFKGWTPPDSDRPLQECQGDCDVDKDCDIGLECFQRYSSFERVPGCKGGESLKGQADFCIRRGATLTPTKTPTVSPTDQPTVTPSKSPSHSPSSSPTSNPSKTPTTLPTTNPSHNPSSKPSVSPTTSPTAKPVEVTPNPTKRPSPNPTKEPSKAPIPEPDMPDRIDCSSYADANFPRFCKEGSCCSNPRKAGGFCERMYTMLGDKVEAACHDCCIEENGFPMDDVAPDNQIHPEIPKTVECDTVTEISSMCKPGRCCEETKSDSDFCKTQYDLFGDDIQSVCWYCCYPSKLVDFDRRRELSSEAEKEDTSTQQDELGKNEKIGYDTMGRKVILRKENFESSGTNAEDYFNEIYESHQRRLDEVPIVENYDDIYWWPYEWLLKVGSEYYFRYEGTQTTPPCINKAHWRVIKDPIRVAPHQIKELERLIAWRLNDQCQGDTAGKPQEGKPDAVDVARPLQEYDSIHRMVFCECQDWPSKFPQERSWCRNWRNRDPKLRFNVNPYNWNQRGF